MSTHDLFNDLADSWGDMPHAEPHEDDCGRCLADWVMESLRHKIIDPPTVEALDALPVGAIIATFLPGEVEPWRVGCKNVGGWWDCVGSRGAFSPKSIVRDGLPVHVLYQPEGADHE